MGVTAAIIPGSEGDSSDSIGIRGGTDASIIGNSGDKLKTDGSGVTQPISAASLPLPTGASTSTLQTTANTSLASIDAGIPAALGQTTMANSMPVVIASDQSTITVLAVQADGTKASYSSSVTGLTMALLATDIFTLTGSGTKTIRVTRVEISGIQTTANVRDVLLIKRSTANSGGTSASQTAVSHDSNNASATATVLSYTANPTLGNSVGAIRSAKLDFGAVSQNGALDRLIWTFGDRPSQAVVLRGTSQVLAVNFNGITSTGNSVDITIEWTEE